MAEGQGDDGRGRPEGGHGHGGIHGGQREEDGHGHGGIHGGQRDDDVHGHGGVHGGQRDDDGHGLRLHGPPLDDHVGGVSGEEDEQRTHVGLVANEVRNEELVHKYRSMIPKVGMTFQSEDEVYEMYNSYAGKVGFSIRKSKTKRRGDGSLCQKFIVCSNQGFRENEESKKDITRTGCDARVQLSISKEGIWRVHKVVEQHNHYLASPNKAHKLRSQRQVIEADRKLIGQIREAGMKPAQIYEFMKQFYGGEENIPFSKMDCNNEIGRERREYLEANDAHTLSEYLRNKQLQDPTFFYAVQVDKEDGRIANFFWADGQSIMDYICFGDAISFDTTFKTNKFEMPFAPILGCNHHKQTIIFGCALLFNETIESFVWLFETFVTAMSGKHPNTIFTDQDAAMAGAIAFVFPYTTHRLCLWHICLNAAKHLAHVIHEADEEGNKFLSDFKSCVYEDRSETYFIEKWNQLLAKYKLENNSWMANLYALRAKWAAVYRDSFTADMNSTQRSEGMNNVFKKRFRRKLGLSELLVECEKVAASLRANELDADFQSRRKNPVPYISNLPMLKTAADSYTRRMYLEFEEEFKRQFTLSCDLLEAAGTNMTFFVKFMESTHGATVVFNNEDLTITCSCRMFDCIGLLCKHALRVLNMNRVYNLSSRYILPRWTKYAKSGFYIEKQGSETGDLQTQAALLSRQATSLALKCSPSKELLDKVQKAIHNLNLEADIYLTEMREKTNEVSSIPTENVQQPSNGCISFRIPEVIKGSKNARFKNVVEKNAGKKKKKGGQKKGELQNNEVETRDEHAGPSSAMGAPVVQVGYANSMRSQFNLLDPSAMVASYIPGGYTRLLMGVDQDASIQNAARKLHFDGAQE